MYSSLHRSVHTYRWEITLLTCGFICVLSSLVLFLSINRVKKENSESHTPEANISALSSKIHIDIAGAVYKPGIYQVPEGARVKDVIASAGGVTKDADDTFLFRDLNQSRIVQDQEKIYIPLQADQKAINSSGTTYSEVLSINNASIEELDSLPNIGPKTALKIVDNRPYQQLEDLTSKKVLGEKLFSNIQHLIRL